MSSDRERKRVAEKVSTWDKFVTSITPGDISVKAKRLSDIADANEAEERRKAELEAVRQKRMNAGQ